MSDRDDKRHDGEVPSEHAWVEDPDAPPSAEEALASKRLRDALEQLSEADDRGEDLDLVKSLRAAWSPETLDEDVHASILDDLPTAEELELAAQLRAELEGSSQPEVVVALRSAWSPAALSDAEHRAIVARAVGGAAGGPKSPHRDNVVAWKPRSQTVRVMVVTTTTVFALAASVVVWMTTAPTHGEAPLAKARSTQPLFGEPFKAGETSARIDRIAMARASDYRDNRFAKWGVR